MRLTPGGDVVEVVARRDGRADHQKQHFRQGVRHLAGLARIVDPSEVIQQKA